MLYFILNRPDILLHVRTRVIRLYIINLFLDRCAIAGVIINGCQRWLWRDAYKPLTPRRHILTCNGVPPWDAAHIPHALLFISELWTQRDKPWRCTIVSGDNTKCSIYYLWCLVTNSKYWWGLVCVCVWIMCKHSCMCASEGILLTSVDLFPCWLYH